MVEFQTRLGRAREIVDALPEGDQAASCRAFIRIADEFMMMTDRFMSVARSREAALKIDEARRAFDEAMAIEIELRLTDGEAQA